MGGGRFLRVDGQGRFSADQFYPSEPETFQSLPGGQGLLVEKHGTRTTVSPPVPGSGEIRVPVFNFSKPQTVEVYRVAELPGMLQVAMEAAVRGLAAGELDGKHYDKTTTHKTEKHIDLPAPTLHDLKRTKREKVLGVAEEYHVQAQLDGPADIGIPHIAYLTGYAEGGPTLLILAIRGRLPVSGRVQYKMDNLASASTGYRAVVELAVVTEVRMKKLSGDVLFEPPKVLDLRLSVSKLSLSNDLLETARRPIEQVINHELRHNEDRIREKANQAVQKALHSKDLHVPLAGYLGVM